MHVFYKEEIVKVLYSIKNPEIEGKTGIIKSYGKLACYDYWYIVEIEGKQYNCFSSQLAYDF